jgi:hypothetical protein
MTDETPSSVRIRDPLSNVTRKERKFLLGISVICITIVKANIFPSKISVLGVEFQQTDQESLLWILGLITLYFLIAFIIYAASDFISWRISFFKAMSSYMRERFDSEIQDDPTYKRLHEYEIEFSQRLYTRIVFLFTGPVAIFRAIFEFLLPVLVSVYAIILVWTTGFPKT